MKSYVLFAKVNFTQHLPEESVLGQCSGNSYPHSSEELIGKAIHFSILEHLLTLSYQAKKILEEGESVRQHEWRITLDSRPLHDKYFFVKDGVRYEGSFTSEFEWKDITEVDPSELRLH